MKKKELISALGLSISLAITACGTPAPQQESVDESVAVEEEQPTEAPTEAAELEKEMEETQESVEEAVKEQPEEKKGAPVEEASEYDIETMDDTTMWAKQDCNIRNKPYVDGSEVIGSLKTGQEIIIIGKVIYKDKTWYLLKSEQKDEKEFVSGSLISTEKIAQNKPSNNKPSGGNTGTVTPAPSDCSVSDCDWGDCEGDCSFTDWNPSFCGDCTETADPGSYCAAAE